MKVNCSYCNEEINLHERGLHICPKTLDVKDMGVAGTAIMEAEYLKIKSQLQELEDVVEYLHACVEYPDTDLENSGFNAYQKKYHGGENGDS